MASKTGPSFSCVRTSSPTPHFFYSPSSPFAPKVARIEKSENEIGKKAGGMGGLGTGEVFRQPMTARWRRGRIRQSLDVRSNLWGRRPNELLCNLNGKLYPQHLKRICRIVCRERRMTRLPQTSSALAEKKGGRNAQSIDLGQF